MATEFSAVAGKSRSVKKENSGRGDGKRVHKKETKWEQKKSATTDRSRIRM